MNAATDDEILDECGMDSLCFLRLLSMGYRISCISALNAIWLLPLYKFTESDEITEKITDPIAQLTIGHVPAGSPRLVGTVIAAYILFGYMMYLILQVRIYFSFLK